MRNLRWTLILSALLYACSSAPAAPPGDNTSRPNADEPARAPLAKAEVSSVQADAQRAATSLTRVEDPSAVCMVNNQYMGTPQIPVAVDGKTYYGCCQMCEARLQQDTSARMGLDPVSKRPVDKAAAVMARDPSGKIVYFESEENLRTYIAAR